MSPIIHATESIAPVAAKESATSSPATSGDFGRWFVNEMNAVNTQMTHAEAGVRQLAAGGTGQLHDVMLRLEEARLQFQLAIQVRSHVVEAFQDIIRMQV